MPDIILHHYPQSPVSEKVRVVLGMKGLDWRSVIIPRLPPKPDLTPLTGGYRLTPVLQIGAEVYCDSLCIIRELERRCPEPTIFPGHSDGMAWGVGRWIDGALFQAAIAVVFASSTETMSPDFAADRGALYFGSGFDLASLSATLPELLVKLRAQLGWMEQRLADGRHFMLGVKPGLPDALCYYLIWFLRGRATLGPDFLAQFQRLMAWERRVEAIGHGTPLDMTATEALEIARAAAPETPEQADPGDPQGLAPGQTVEVMPECTIGNPPVAGRIRAVSAQEIVIDREDARVGLVAVHFPRVGYRVVRT